MRRLDAAAGVNETAPRGSGDAAGPAAPSLRPSRAACLDAVFGHLLAVQVIADYMNETHLAAIATYALDEARGIQQRDAAVG